MISNNTTIVTALFDLNRGSLESGFARSYDQYLNSFKQLLEVDLPMVIFCDEETEKFVFKHRNQENTRVVRKTLDDLRAFPFYDKIQKIRQNEDWKNRSGWIPNSPQAALELYNPLVMMKQFFLNDASIFNYFSTKFFCWLDAGISNTVAIKGYLTPELMKKLEKQMNRMCYIAFPYDGNVEVHGFEKGAFDRYADAKTEYVVRGGFFGGTRNTIAEINDIYYNLLQDTLNSGLMGTEESIFTLISYRHPEKCNVNFIESNGLIYKFFEDLRNQPEDIYNDEMVFYTLTFNEPKQFKMWVDSFLTAYPKIFNKTKKYVINNSTDRNTDKEYAELFEQYDFEEFKFDNIGINGGRQFAAEHFLQSKASYMVFFEDDFAFYKKGSGVCKNGFSTYQENLFDNALDIVKLNNFDYLKLTFTEFYGDNHYNWAYKNLPEAKKNEYFPRGETGVRDWHTKIFHTDTYKGLPYAYGEYHVCNWPIIMSRQGTETIFGKSSYKDPLYEQQWMAQTMIDMRNGKIKAGCLLATPINHHRAHHYAPGTRRENSHYTN